MSLRQLCAVYMERYYRVNCPKSFPNERYVVNVISRTVLPRANGTLQALGDWPVSAITVDTLERFKEQRVPDGTGARVTSTNRCLARLRAIFNWAILKSYMTSTPFKVNGVTAVSLFREQARRRRLEEGEEEGLLTVCKPHLRALVEAALETCCREGELLSLQWLQVRWNQNELFFPGAKTKSGRDVFIPMSQRLRAILEMRYLDPAGEPMALTGYVFGNEIGMRVKSIERAWQTAVLKSHGYTPRWKNGALTAQSREDYGRINLHFHDLRREAASRLLEGDVPEQYVQAVLGHADLSTTSKYLAVEFPTSLDTLCNRRCPESGGHS